MRRANLSRGRVEMSSSSRARCRIHGTVLSPDGQCVLCRSRNPEERPTHWGRLALGLAIVTVGFVIFTLSRVSSDWGTKATNAPVHALREDLASRSEPRASIPSEHAQSASSGATTPLNAATPPKGQATLSHFEHARFSERDPRGFLRELQARGEQDLTGDYQAKDESFEIVMPTNARESDPMGVLVWISASPSGVLPSADYAPVLAAHHLIWIGPNRAGNEREVAVRLGLALDSVLAARRRANLDPSRLFIGGISGGAKTAFRALLYFPEVFRAALLSAGIEYIRDVPMQSRPGSFWPARIGRPSDLRLAKLRPIAITTGPRDFNHTQIYDVVAALGQDQFSHVTIFDWPELGHGPPPAELFERALRWLEDSNRAGQLQ